MPLLYTLGLAPTAAGLQPPNHAAGYIIANFTLAYLVFTSRLLKKFCGLDNNISPRQDIAERGERMVADGKISRRMLNLVKRNEAAHANSMEHFTIFVAAMLFSLHAKLPASTVNTAGAIYTAARVVYGIAYITIETTNLSYIRSIAWWVSNIICLHTLARSGKALNA